MRLMPGRAASARYHGGPTAAARLSNMPIYSIGERHVQLLGDHHYIAHDAVLVGDIVLEDCVNIWFGVSIRADNDSVRIGAGTNIQEGSVLHVDPDFPMRLGRNVTVGHKVMLHGCAVGDGALIGINSVVLNGAKIGAGTLIGANSLIPEGKDIPAGVLVLGSPGKVVRELTPEEQARLLEIPANYVERSKLFKTQMREQPLPPSAR
jgi:carbonic anhydrase/acetyltransferase-like protein (isoleucine patch superfamily)